MFKDDVLLLPIASGTPWLGHRPLALTLLRLLPCAVCQGRCRCSECHGWRLRGSWKGRPCSKCGFCLPCDGPCRCATCHGTGGSLGPCTVCGTSDPRHAHHERVILSARRVGCRSQATHVVCANGGRRSFKQRCV